MSSLIYLIEGSLLLITIYNLGFIFKWTPVLYIIAHLNPSKKVWRILQFNSLNYISTGLLTKKEAEIYVQKISGVAYIDYKNGEW